jgi:TPR repeat protein
MLNKFFVAALIVMAFSSLPARAAEKTTASEDEKTRLDKQEITALIGKIGGMPRAQQNSEVDRISSNASGSKTPRSDFTFCMGLAFLGNYKAQACVGNAFEHGLGIVEDPTDAYVWYTIALENRIDDEAAQKRLQADKERVSLRFRLNYPSPTDDELDDLVNAQKKQIGQYRDEATKANKRRP